MVKLLMKATGVKELVMFHLHDWLVKRRIKGGEKTLALNISNMRVVYVGSG